MIAIHLRRKESWTKNFLWHFDSGVWVDCSLLYELSVIGLDWIESHDVPRVSPASELLVLAMKPLKLL